MKWKKLEVLEEQIRNDVNAIMYEKGTTGSSQQQSTEGISKIFPAKKRQNGRQHFPALHLHSCILQPASL